MDTSITTAKKRIGELLVEAGLITPADLAAALKRQKKCRERIVTILISMGALDSRAFAEFLASPGTYKQVEIGNFQIDQEVIELIPKGFALSKQVVPIDRMGNILTLAMMCPLDEQTIVALEEHTGCRIKPVICAHDDIHAALIRHYEPEKLKDAPLSVLEAPLRLATAAALLRHIESLPALPGTVAQVRQLIYVEEGSAAEVAEAIAQDPAMAAKVLRIANSAAYGFPNRVDNIQLAVTLLGMVETYSIVVSTAIVNQFRTATSFNHMSYWLESVVCANLATALARSFSTHNKTGMFAAGLLHDIGRVALAEVAPRHYGNVDGNAVGLELVAAEERHLGVAHTEAGYQLAGHWGLPADLAECIRFHHHPHLACPEMRTMVSMVNIASVIAQAHRLDSDDREADLSECRGSMNYLELSEDDILQVFRGAPDPDPIDAFWSVN